MSGERTVAAEIGCLSCLGLIVLLGAVLGVAWGLMIGLAHWIGGLFT
ncbi:hypothetical protein HNO88_000274 [Novosphingobium chloroacetimidivorans]|uniref:Uncharacterized protein n=1 Tax=Novosphingobium chloroacetimidivorans TaxID=1428314 RepID=A0A7W7K674_9SPHN|nr:hypothetical protein [Novosphingobium chloroacetimidivorans]MBB4856977.1 hypothetical protein [Novosphingobium chloroacetimidivorans]